QAISGSGAAGLTVPDVMGSAALHFFAVEMADPRDEARRLCQNRSKSWNLSKSCKPKRRTSIDKLTRPSRRDKTWTPSMAGTYKSSDTIPTTGVYRVVHAQHRLPHEVTLIEGQTFPPCSKCHDEVRFELVRELPSLGRERRGSVSLYVLPVLEEEE